MPDRKTVRWLLSLLVAVSGVWLFHGLALWIIRRLAGLPGAWLLTLLAAYGFLVLGFGFGEIVTRIAPGRRYLVAVLLVFGTIIVAARLALDGTTQALSATGLGVALVGGAVGHALRRRGFTERFSRA